MVLVAELAPVLINKVKSKCCGIKVYQKNADGADVFLFNYKGQAVGVFLSYTEGYVNIRMSSFGPADSRLMEMK